MLIGRSSIGGSFPFLHPLSFSKSDARISPPLLCPPRPVGRAERETYKLWQECLGAPYHCKGQAQWAYEIIIYHHARALMLLESWRAARRRWDISLHTMGSATS